MLLIRVSFLKYRAIPQRFMAVGEVAKKADADSTACVLPSIMPLGINVL